MDDTDVQVLLLVLGFFINLASGIGATVVAQRRGASGLGGFLLGFLLGPVGLLLSFVIFKAPSSQPVVMSAPYVPLQAAPTDAIPPPVLPSFRCPVCSTAVAELRGFCPYCGSVLKPAQPAAVKRRVFISFASPDKAVADRVCFALEAAGVACWIAHRDIAPGMDYARAILESIRSAEVLVLISSEHANGSPNVETEVQHAFDGKKRIIPFRLTSGALSQELEYFLRRFQWIEALDGCTDANLKRLTEAVLAALAPEQHPLVMPQSSVVPVSQPGLVGTWVTEEGLGSLVSSTGAFQGASYYGETYFFEADGTYRHRTVGSGPIISGVALMQGSYSFEGGFLVIHEAFESWNGGPNKPIGQTRRFGWSMPNSQTLVLHEAQGGYASSTYTATTLYRVTGELRASA